MGIPDAARRISLSSEKLQGLALIAESLTESLATEDLCTFPTEIRILMFEI